MLCPHCKNPIDLSVLIKAEGAAPQEITAKGSLPLNDGSEFVITSEFMNELAELYPAVDLCQEFRKMKAWLIANPQKKKTRRGIKRFITNWLSREQDKGGSRSQGAPAAPKQNKAELGWIDVRKVISGAQKKFSDPLASKVVHEVMGGTHTLGNLSERDLSFRKQDFIAAYNAELAQRGE